MDIKLRDLGVNIYPIITTPGENVIILEHNEDFLNLVKSEGIITIFSNIGYLKPEDIVITPETVDEKLQIYINREQIKLIIHNDIEQYNESVLSADYSIPSLVIYTALLSCIPISCYCRPNPVLATLYDEYVSLDPSDVVQSIIDQHYETISILEADGHTEEYEQINQLITTLQEELITDTSFALRTPIEKLLYLEEVLSRDEYKDLLGILADRIDNLHGTRIKLTQEGNAFLRTVAESSAKYLDNLTTIMQAEISELIKADLSFIRQTNAPKRASYLIQWFKDNNKDGKYDLLYDIYISRGRQGLLIASKTGQYFIDSLYKA